MSHDNTYLAALEEILMKGKRKGDRTGTGTLSRFGMQMRFDLSEGFPLLTTKRMPFRTILWELLWFLRGETNNNWLNERGVTIWDEWSLPDGELGPIYGRQWRSWPYYDIREEFVEQYDILGRETSYYIDHAVYKEVDQLQQVVDTLITNPNDRRMIVSAWNVADIPKMQLPPCHLLFQFYVWRNKLSCQLYQRSADMFLGVPFNLASYSALIHLIAHLTGMEVGEFIWVGGDCHIYNNHMNQVQEQLTRTPYESPTLRINGFAPNILDGEWEPDHFTLEGYQHHPGISAPVAV